eukprot:gene2783-3076_t
MQAQRKRLQDCHNAGKGTVRGLGSNLYFRDMSRIRRQTCCIGGHVVVSKKMVPLVIELDSLVQLVGLDEIGHRQVQGVAHPEALQAALQDMAAARHQAAPMQSSEGLAAAPIT